MIMSKSMLIAVAGTIALALSPLTARAEGLAGGGPFGQQTNPCLTPADWALAADGIAAYEKGFGPISAGAPLLGPPLYPAYPMAGTLYRDLWIWNFVDLDPTGGILDWDCTDRTYNGHDASDTIIRSFGEQLIGVPIFAALDGIVVSTHDGEDDMHTTCEGIGNHVIIDHGLGRLVYYWHFKRDSIVVSVAQQVRAGEPLGLTGSSGCSTYPHLHFASYNDDVVFEPWAGDCRPGPSGWENQIRIEKDLYLYDFGVTYEDMNEYPGPPYEFPRSGQIGLGDQVVYFWTMTLEFPAFSTWRVRFERPDGTIAYDSGTQRFGNPNLYHYAWWWWGYNITDMHSITGTWHIWLYINGDLMITAPVEVRQRVTPDFNRPPEPITVSLEPADPTVDDVIFCRVDTSLVLDDVDYDIVRYEYVWIVNGLEVRHVTTAGHADALRHHTACEGAVVQCTVTPSDGIDAGPPASALLVVLGDSVGDLNCDGAVGIIDLLTLLATWGPCADCNSCPADLDADCAVGVLDLLTLRANWG